MNIEIYRKHFNPLTENNLNISFMFIGFRIINDYTSILYKNIILDTSDYLLYHLNKYINANSGCVFLQKC